MVNLFYFVLFTIGDNCAPADDDEIKIDSKPIFFITPTYDRPVQEPELIRLAQTLLHDRNIHWILVEDSPQKTAKVSRILSNVVRRKIHRFNYTHLNAQTPVAFKTSLDDPNWLKPRGVWQRNEAIRWLREEYSGSNNGVVYFGDDDNTYHMELFDEIRKTRQVSVFPVGLVGGLLVEKPLINSQGKIIGFNSIWNTKRKYPIDMSAFAIDLSLIRKKDAWFSENVPRGFQETHLLTQLIDGWNQLEPLSINKILVWHTRTENPKLRIQKKKKLSSSSSQSSNQLPKPR